MSTPRVPSPAKLVVGCFSKEQALFGRVAGELAQRFGPLDMVSQWLPFDFTRYYEAEMGAPLFRRMMAFQKLVQQDALVEIKLATNQVERDFAEKGGRLVNIDPGLLVHERFVLATGKNFTHRIYLGKGIFADLTLLFQKGAFQSLPWTYPDYDDERMRAFLTLARRKYRVDLKQGSHFPSGAK